MVGILKAVVNVSPFAGKLVNPSHLTDISKLVSAYYELSPDVSVPAQRVIFGTSGHRGSSLQASFNEKHILAICEAICRYRQKEGINGPLFLGIDTHALSVPAQRSAIEVFAAHAVDLRIDAEGGFTPTPIVSHAIITHNRGRIGNLADGVVITPSHNPPADGGLKYNSPHGGPADTETTIAIQELANAILVDDLKGVQRLTYDKAIQASCVKLYDYINPYVADLNSVIDMTVIKEAGIKIGIDPLGGASLAYWSRIIDTYGLNAEIVNKQIDSTFSFMTADWDGKIRMDCSSVYAMAHLIDLKDRFDVAFANDPDADRHGIVSAPYGLMNPNHFLATCAAYLFRHRPEWNVNLGIGKTLVSSALIDRVATDLVRPLVEMPVGLKWFVPGLINGTLGFCGEESAGATFLRKDGTVWTTDKDGIVLCLLAAEITARTGKTPGTSYHELASRLGTPYYGRIDAPANFQQKTKLSRLSPEQFTLMRLAGEPVLKKISHAPGNDAPLGGLKVITQSGWFAARPSGTEDVYKIYAESFKSAEHLHLIQKEAQASIAAFFSS